MPFPPHRILALLAGSALSLLVCCGPRTPENELRILDAWARPMAVERAEDGSLPPVNSAIYLKVVNSGLVPDRLLGGETPIADALEIHESLLQGDVMRMRGVESVEIPANGRVDMQPGGLHIMLLGLRRPLTVGDTIALMLTFEESGALVVRVPVQITGGL